MRPAALFCYVVGIGAPLALVCADPNMTLPWFAYSLVLCVALAALYGCHTLDRAGE